MPTFSQTETAISERDIAEIERHAGVTFPDEYRAHLLRFNGGRCEPNVFSFRENGKLTTSCVDWFLAIYEGKYDSLRNYVTTYKIEEKRLPDHLLPIAHDPGGNLICILCARADAGAIYFWDHEKEVDYERSDDGDYSNLYFIAPSFNQFMAELHS